MGATGSYWERLGAARVRGCEGGVRGHTGELEEEELSEEMATRLAAEPADPPLDYEQLRAVKAELRNLVPGIHEACPPPPPMHGGGDA